MMIKDQTIAACVALGVAAMPASAPAQVLPFYSGRSVTIVVGHGPGTGFDLYARALGRHIGRHLAGGPNVIVQNMSGASGIAAANWAYNAAAKDGTVLATFVHTVPFEPILGNTAARFDAEKFTWIGNMEESVGICGVNHKSGINHFDDLKIKQINFGATGATGQLAKFSLAVKNLLGAQIRLISGYQSSAAVKMALQTGEVSGVCGLPMSTVSSFWLDEYRLGHFKPVLQLSGPKDARLQGIPHVRDFPVSDADRSLFALVFEAQRLGRLLLAPPGIGTERTSELRAAFMDTMKDQKFLSDAAATGLETSAMSGEEVEVLVKTLAHVTPDLVDRAKRALDHR